ncbi:hypothetical protein EYW49_08940 [Siculibacillus lacustris]|uniref:HD domain-containing protein n=1 Tax=Siculibacillus lacustris TaxID=1549641 RepID=A0A4Q9VS75_9HYPH|nr:hypothetical protein [Siculibacillus lacustris]TBW38804.1 hypothetical protein EYW49_08940 [Siculibacillus lacustris]
MTAWMQTSTGCAVDLTKPSLVRLDVAADIAGPLSRLARFNGHMADNTAGCRPIWSVAQHCVVGADAVLVETRSVASALAFLTHDAHEALIGDITTPAAQAIEAHVGWALRHVFGIEATHTVRAALGTDLVAAALGGLKAQIDRHIHRLAGLPEVLPEAMRRIVKEMDLRMLDLERRQILGDCDDPTIWPPSVIAARPVRIRGALTPWPAKRAAAEWLRRWDAWRIRTAVAPTPNDSNPRRRNGAAVAA